MAGVTINSPEWWEDQMEVYEREVLAAFIKALERIMFASTGKSTEGIGEGRLIGWSFRDRSAFIFLDQCKIGYIYQPIAFHTWVSTGGGPVLLNFKLKKDWWNKHGNKGK